MEIINYSEEHRIFRNSLRKYLEKEVTPHVEEWEEAGIVPRSAWKGMGEQGFLCMGVPEEYGGLGADFLYSVIVIEEMVRTNHSGLAASLHSDIIVPYIVAFASEEQKRKYLPGCVSGDIIMTFPPETDPFSIGVLPDKEKPYKGGQRNEREAIFTGADHQDHQGIGVGSQEH